MLKNVCKKCSVDENDFCYECGIHHGCKHISGEFEDYIGKTKNCCSCLCSSFYFDGKCYSDYKNIRDIHDSLKYEEILKMMEEHDIEIEKEEFKELFNSFKVYWIVKIGMSLLLRTPSWVKEQILAGGNIENFPKPMIDLIKSRMIPKGIK
jgi:hypothetical protein